MTSSIRIDTSHVDNIIALFPFEVSESLWNFPLIVKSSYDLIKAGILGLRNLVKYPNSITLKTELYPWKF